MTEVFCLLIIIEKRCGAVSDQKPACICNIDYT